MLNYFKNNKKSKNLIYILCAVVFIPLVLTIIPRIFNYSTLLEPRGAGAIITALVAAVAAYIAYDRLEAYHSQRYIESINTERREWLNTLRVTCKEYYSLAETLYDNPNSMSSLKQRKLEGQLSEKIIYLKLLTNPKEEHIKVLHKLMEEPPVNRMNENNVENNVNCGSDFDKQKKRIVKKWLKHIESTMQIILKTEWSIIKEETNRGRELEGIEKKSKLIEAISNTKEGLGGVEDLHPYLLAYSNCSCSKNCNCNNHHEEG